MSEMDLERISDMTEDELDRLPFGAIRLDREGTVVSFNESEAKLTGRRPDDVIGRNFFKDVAPCTDVQEFAGRYREGVRKGSLHAVFPYHFDYKMEPRNVWVTLFYSDSSESGWVFVRERREGTAA